MTSTPTPSSPSMSLSRYKERISLYEDPSNPLAPLTSAQKELIMDLTHNPVERPIPPHLKSIPKTKTVEFMKGNVNKPPVEGVDFDKFTFKTKYEVSLYNNYCKLC